MAKEPILSPIVNPKRRRAREVKEVSNEPVLLHVVKCRARATAGQHGRVSANFDLCTEVSFKSVAFEVTARSEKERDGIRFTLAQDRGGADDDVLSKLSHDYVKKMISEKHEKGLYIRDVRGATNPFTISIFGLKR